MKKNALSLAVATSVAALTMASAHAANEMYLNHEGTGEVLLFPFYDAENGNATNFHVVNTTGKAKAVKVRFLEYKASYEVLDFNLFLSPKDHFAFGVVMDPNGTGGAIITQDNSCTVPALGSPNNGIDGTTVVNADGSITRTQPFVNFEFQKGKFVDQDLARTLRGHVEIIEMGVVIDTTPAITGAPTPTEASQQFASWATHGADGVPAACDKLAGAYISGGWSSKAGLKTNVSTPEGGLYGLAYHINVEDAAAYGFEPAAIEDWADPTTNFHFTPGTISPSLGTTANTGSIVLDSGSSTAAAYPTALDAVSSLFMTQTITNDVMLNSAIGGMTDWVTTFPTKRTYVTNGLLPAKDPKQPFTDAYAGRSLNAAETAYEELESCEPVTPASTDREEARTIGGNGFSPGPVGGEGAEICNEQHVAAWGPAGTKSAVNGERGLVNVAVAYSEGWSEWQFSMNATGQTIDTNANYLMSTAGGTLVGLPAQGFAAYKYANGSSGSVMMNYGHVADHKTSVLVSGSIGTGVSQ